MSQEIGTSHIWIPIDSSDIKRGEMPTNESERAINLHDKFPLPSGEVLQDIWDERIEDTTEVRNGLVLPYTILNPKAEGGTVFRYLGFGSSAREAGGAREAVALAGINTDQRVVIIDELQNVPRDIKVASFLKDIKPYADAHMYHVYDMERKYGIVPTTVAGRSKGGRVSNIIVAHPDMPELDYVVTADMPGAHHYRSKLHLAIDVGVRENMSKYKAPTLVGIDEAEEKILTELNIPTAEPMTLREASKQIWMMRGLGALGLVYEFDMAMYSQQEAQFINFHATGNLGMPIEDNNEMIKEMQDKYGSRIRAYIGYTRHFSEGHGPRFGRQLAEAIN